MSLLCLGITSEKIIIEHVLDGINTNNCDYFWLFITNVITTAGKLKPDGLQRSVSGFKDNRQRDQESTCPSKDPTSLGQSRTVPMSLILFEEVRVIIGKLNGLHNTSLFVYLLC